MDQLTSFRVKLKALGCRLNEAELETWARQFEAAGMTVVGEAEPADLVVFNSCAVTGDAARKSRNHFRKAARENPGARMVLSGCYATLEPGQAAELGVDLIVPNADKHRLVEIARRELELPEFVEPLPGKQDSSLFRLGRHRAFVKVQDGCRHRCTYCIVTVARGEERSRTVAEIVDEINAHHRQGLQEAVLTGVHLGGYGSDLEGVNLTRLILEILAGTSIPRLRLGSLEPWDLPDDFARLFENKRLMPHLHLPLQSGADSVLRRMARRCRTDDFARLVQTLRRDVPDINITTDIIVGFPGESDDEWATGLAFIEAIRFGHVHVFSFSPRSGTAAAGMPLQVHGELKKQRSQELLELSRRQRQDFLSGFAGVECEVLWEGASRDDDGVVWHFGYTPNFLKVGVSGYDEDALSYRVLPACLGELADSGDFLEARLKVLP